MKPELRGELRQVLVELEHRGIGVRGVVGDAGEQLEAVLTEERSAGRGGEAGGEVDGRQAAGAAVLQRPPQEQEIVGGLPLELLGDRPMEPPSEVGRYVVSRCGADEVVRQTDASSLRDDDPALRKLERSVLGAGVRPLEERRRSLDVEREARDDEQGQQRGRVGARGARAGRHQLRGVAFVAAAPGQRLEPEGRSGRALPDPAGSLRVELTGEVADERDPVGRAERAELDRRDPLAAERPRERVREHAGARGRARGGEHHQRLITVRGRADEVLAQREREVVDPLHVVDDHDLRPERAERAVRRLEHPDGLERRGLRERAEGDGIEPITVLFHLGQRAQQARGRRERDLLLGLVADDPQGALGAGPCDRLGEQARLARAGIPGDERGRRALRATPSHRTSEGGQLRLAAEEGHRSSVMQQRGRSPDAIGPSEAAWALSIPGGYVRRQTDDFPLRPTSQERDSSERVRNRR